MNTFLYAALGFTLATVVAWGGLLVWAFIFLDRHDSYWDHAPGAAETFFVCWLLSGIVAAFIAAWMSRTRRSS
ncbi:hypothetical protein ACFFTM_03410 [Pseudoduganella plicata]|uniref:Uncharacterized protein n=1 Tax=Pseudoduganella plicata TaxID=321984 RepID=A0A4P7BEF8_9BURK|nr:hypothetical protein [Pseudoduganella plicata]QBQ36994.1 hypothetical protein E1742_13070 [Pseudoduganella plicata]GGZ08236.1 hypothetical protein GCM10007388_47250 [Pseudoduganella plicata]